MVEGNLYSWPSIILFKTWRNIFPLLVFGSLSTMMAFWKEATGPIYFLIRDINYFSIPYLEQPLLSIIKPMGISPFKSSIFATTAASHTLGCLNSYSSICEVERRWPAVLIISSNRVITLRYPSLSKYPASPVV